jgi:drug/metabolite transporter (DMT)-like permease
MAAGMGRNEGLLLMTGALWGTAYVAIKVGLKDGDPYLFALLRFVLASVVLFAFIVYAKKFDTSVFRDRTIWLVGLLNALCIVLQNVGMTMTSATNAVLLFNINVGFVAILAAVILKDKLARMVLIGLFTGMVGVLLISTNGDLSTIYSGTFQGNLLVLLSGLLWAFCTVYLKKVLDRGKDVTMFTGAMFLLSVVFLLPMTAVFTTSYAMDGVAWASVVWTGVVCTGIAYLTYNIGLQRVSVTVATILLLSEVVFAMLFALLFLGEVPTGSIALGGGLIVLSVVLISLAGHSARADRPKKFARSSRTRKS